MPVSHLALFNMLLDLSDTNRVDDVWEGTGTYFKASGETYSGGWLRGARHGPGVATDSRGRVVKGTWLHGDLHGEAGHSAGPGGSGGPGRGAGSAVGSGVGGGDGRWGSGGGPEDHDEDEERTLGSLASLDGPSVATGASYDYNADFN